MKRRSTLLGIAPAPDGSSDSAPSHSVPPPSSSPTSADGASKFEAAAQLLEQKRASMAPKPPPSGENGVPSERAPKSARDDADSPTPASKPSNETTDATTPPPAEVGPESVRPPRSERAEASPKSRRRRSSAPPAPRGIGIVPVVIAAAVFVVMFLVGAMRAMRDELRDAKPSSKIPSAVVESPPAAEQPVSPASLPVATSAAVASPEPAQPEPSAAETAVPAESAAPPVASASAEPVQTGDALKVMVRSAVAGAKFYRNGKQVGMNSVIVELAPGEKRAFEVNLPGYVSRKVVVDGSRSEVVVYLPRISEAPSAAAPSPAGEAQSANSAP
jgi:hypothetical protein